MPSFFKSSLRNKLLTLFIGMGLLPSITLLLYTLFLSETKIVNKIVIEQFERTDVIIRLIDNHLTMLQKQTKFLSSLDLMDDLLADDIDKRVSRLLTKKYNDLSSLDISFHVISNNSIIIASSNKESLQTKFSNKKFQKKNGFYIQNTTLYIYSKIDSSFNKNLTLGYLLLTYNLKNLNLYLTDTQNMHSYIIEPTHNIHIGKQLPLQINFTDNENSLINSDHVIIYKKLSHILKNWYIVYGVDKNLALEFLYDFIQFILIMSLAIFIFIIYVSLKYSREIVKPIEKLTTITDEIIKTKNYSKRLNITTQDEIATLTISFNKMLETTSSALQNLETENQLRLKRFTQLINLFNTIIQTKSEEECITTSMSEIKKLTNNEKLHFQKDKLLIQNNKYIDLYVTNFKDNTDIYFGSIELDIDRFKDRYEKDFYNSIASMITLQLDKIRLIQRTMAASNAKSAFISNMSHELRTPLNSIIGFAQFMITYEELNEDQIDTIGNIESSAQYLLTMINEILDIAKIEAGKMEIHSQKVDILNLIEESYNMLEPLASEKELAFHLIYKDFKSTPYTTDPKLFKQIILNLLSNAIKFTQKGSIILELSNNNKRLLVSITDSGIGIEKNKIHKLFNEFTQVENVMQKKHKGTGLGLSLSRKMAHLLDGDIELKSDGLGLGTTSLFWIQ